MDKFWQLFEESTIVQALVTVGLIGTDCTLVIQGRTIPDVVMALTWAVMGFWFGTKAQQVIHAASQSGGS